jgi:hydroxymethylpyrimidine/phosphomethylpyrimidine kinase
LPHRPVKDLVASRSTPPVALTVAGFDPSSGAGMTADLKVFAAQGVYGVSAIAALTVQSTQGVRRVQPVEGQLLRQTLACLAEDVPIAGVKIGMLGTAEAVAAVAGFLRESGISRDRVVLDPVIRSSSGAELLEPDGVRVMREELLPAVGWVTPNLDELAVLTDEPVAGRESVPVLASRLARLGTGSGLSVVATGGHLDPPDDFLRTAGGEEIWFPGTRVATTSTHGTGCAFSSALLCRLLLGDQPAEAVAAAKAWVRRALESAVPIGKGRGPVTAGL